MLQTATADDMVALYDALVRNLEALSDVAAELSGHQAESLIEECSALVAVCQAARFYFAAHAHLSAGKPLEAFALFQRIAEVARTAASRLQELPQPPQPWLSELQAVTHEAVLFQSVRRLCCALLSAGLWSFLVGFHTFALAFKCV